MAGFNTDPDPDDPRVQEDIQAAVTQAHTSAFGAYKSHEDLVDAARAYLSGSYGSGTGTEEVIRAILGEAQRQAQPAEGVGDAESPGYDPPSAGQGGDEFVVQGRGSVTSAPHDPVAGLFLDHWLDNAEIGALRHAAEYPDWLMSDRYDPSLPSDYYRGYISALVTLLRVVEIATSGSLQHYQTVVDLIDQYMCSRAGTPDQSSGARDAMINAAQYPKTGVTVSDITAFLRVEMACVAECFYLARRSPQARGALFTEIGTMTGQSTCDFCGRADLDETVALLVHSVDGDPLSNMFGCHPCAARVTRRSQ